MKKLVTYLITGMLFCGFIACSDDDKIGEPDDKGGNENQENELPAGYFVLCRGNENANNATLGFYDFTTDKYEKDIFSKQNGEKLGELAQEMVIYGEKIYITMYGSNSILVTDLEANLIQAIKPAGNEDMGPRSLAVDDGKVFVGYFKGHSVAVLDTVSLTIQKTIRVGRYPEQMAVNKGKLYVTNSGGLDWNNEWGYDNTVSVIDIATLEKETDLIVEINPTKIVSDGQDNIYVISMGDYVDEETNALQKIDLQTGKAQKIGKASLMTLVNNKLYTIYAQYWYTAEEIEYISYNAKTGNKENDSYVKEAIVGNPYSLNVSPEDGSIYISHFVWQETNDLYIFNKDGKKSSVQETDGYDVAGIWFRP